MNYRAIGFFTGKVLLIEAALMSLPCLCSIIYHEHDFVFFLITAGILFIPGLILGLRQPNNMKMHAKEGFVAVALSWILLSAFGALPFLLSGAIPNYIDCLFETVSGFTTTGATILNDIEKLGHGLLFWRGFTHWIGGMGVLVFILAIIPSSGSNAMFIMRAEVPGPSVGKLSSKIKDTAKTLYILYLILTVFEVVMLCAGGMSFYDALVHSFATAGTGGFSSYNKSVEFFNNPYFEIVIAVFMFLFGMNFNIFYMLIVGKIREALKSEELRVYFFIVLISTICICFDIRGLYSSLSDSLRASFFQVSSIMTTTGFTTTNFNYWPSFSKIFLLLLMFVGGCAGSTAGGLKVARLIVLFKSAKREIKRMAHPHLVSVVTFEEKPLDEKRTSATNLYLTVYFCILIISLLLVSLEKKDVMDIFSSVISCFNNVGPIISTNGPLVNYSNFSVLSKLVLILDMLLGRLELFPILILFLPSIWFKNSNKAY